MEPCAAHVLPVAGCSAHSVAELALGCRECSWKERHRSLLPPCWSDSGHQAWWQVPWPYIEPSWKLELHLLIPLPPRLKCRTADVFLHPVSTVWDQAGGPVLCQLQVYSYAWSPRHWDRAGGPVPCQPLSLPAHLLFCFALHNSIGFPFGKDHQTFLYFFFVFSDIPLVIEKKGKIC